MNINVEMNISSISKNDFSSYQSIILRDMCLIIVFNFLLMHAIMQINWIDIFLFLLFLNKIHLKTITDFMFEFVRAIPTFLI